ncbi:Malic acid transport protein [Erysiphe necator]|uniref:Putative c4-dicarboxylate transporter malic acid transport protein n=1 Tax=Uncinula necator TaxID=52586 RepID=A0A0B1P962_UNCNE|nr:Malic acid transport protein [Erysiphe necator]KHJ33501.1 putative c4-dicarboxylate transporter malic acid transport protein [Erysiphe necator]
MEDEGDYKTYKNSSPRRSQSDLENQSSIEDSMEEKSKIMPIMELTLKERLKHFTFAWYASTMSTGGIAFTLSVLPNRFPGLDEIGAAIFILNIFLFFIITGLMIARFVIFKGTFRHAFINPHEGFFSATFWLTLATMMSNSTVYGVPHAGPWLVTALRYGFWAYTVLVTAHSIIYYNILFTNHKLVLTNVLPGWVLPIFPPMLVGTLASAIARLQEAEDALPILVAGLSYQGLGMMIAMFMYSLYFGRLLTSGLPADMSRPAMFIAVGPPAFTSLAFIGMAQCVTQAEIFETDIGLEGVDSALIEPMLLLLALIVSIFLWVLSFWFFSIALLATIEALPRNDFHLNWYAYVFPNVGFTIATIKIGQRLNSPGIVGVGTGMTAVLFGLWLLIVTCHVKAFVKKQICWPGKDEDAH